MEASRQWTLGSCEESPSLIQVPTCTTESALLGQRSVAALGPHPVPIVVGAPERRASGTLYMVASRSERSWLSLNSLANLSSSGSSGFLVSRSLPAARPERGLEEAFACQVGRCKVWRRPCPRIRWARRRRTAPIRECTENKFAPQTRFDDVRRLSSVHPCSQPSARALAPPWQGRLRDWRLLGSQR